MIPFELYCTQLQALQFIHLLRDTVLPRQSTACDLMTMVIANSSTLGQHCVTRLHNICWWCQRWALNLLLSPLLTFDLILAWISISYFQLWPVVPLQHLHIEYPGDSSSRARCTWFKMTLSGDWVSQHTAVIYYRAHAPLSLYSQTPLPPAASVNPNLSPT
jgi:hypothetical protein